MNNLIGNYPIVECIGYGYQANIYKIDYDRDGYHHAVLKQFKIDAYQWQTQLSNEYKSLHKLKKNSKPRGIPMVLQYSPTERYIVLDYIPGQRIYVPLDKRKAFNWWLRLAEAVMYAHDQGVYHCDINPNNILVDGETVALLDWACSSRARSKQLASGLARGVWQPPEQPQGYLGRKTDVYSLAAILLWLLSGCQPRDPVFQSKDRRSQQVIASVIDAPLGLASKELAAYLEKGTAGNMCLRYNSVRPFYRHIAEWVQRYY